jgi:hypothetical protein
MGTNKVTVKYFLCMLVLMLPAGLLAQAEFVEYNNPVYNFLERMDASHIIEKYNSFEKPATRRQIANYLTEVEKNLSSLSDTDKKIFDDLKVEFELELNGTLINSESLFNGNGYNFLSDKERYLYSMYERNKFTLFVNGIAQFNYINSNDNEINNSASASFLKYGGQLRGTILDRIGYSVQATNGKVWGDRQAALNMKEILFSYKYNTDPSNHTGNDFVDNTEGYISADFDLLQLKLGRDRKTIGYGPLPIILGDNFPSFDYLQFDFNYKIFSFSYVHGRLNGVTSSYTDTVQGGIRNVAEKYFGYHRFGFNISKHISFGLGEMIIYGNRSLDFTYLNPFNFYKSVEHANQDRDNSLMFLDVQNNSLNGLKIFGSVIMDDMDFGKIGKGWFGNQLLYNLTLYSASLYKILPLEFYLQYIRCEPYMFTHRIHNNSYTSFGYNLVNPIIPNSDKYLVRINYNPYYRLNFSLEASFTRHGANELNADGTVRINYGGDVLVGHREFDKTEVYFLEGIKEYYRNISFCTSYEPVNNYYFILNLVYENNSLANSIRQKFVNGFITLSFRI